MAKQPTGITRESILQDIYNSINSGVASSAASSGLLPGSLDYAPGGRADQLRSAAVNERDRQTQLKYLLNAGFNTGGFGADGGGSGGYVNPFATGGGGTGAPTVDTSNRFEAGLSDTEARLRALLDNPDSINQSAAYKFRVGQGQEAINRQMGAKGMLNSGNRLMELTKYGQDMASQEYDAQAGRLGSLLGNYSGSWIGDKNANTGRYAAQANAWNTAQANADRTKLGYAEIAGANSRAAMGANSGGSRTYGVNSGFDKSLYSSGPAPATDPWTYNTGSYNGIDSAYTNDLTGQQQIRRG